MLARRPIRPSGVCVLGLRKNCLGGRRSPFFFGHFSAHVGEPIRDVLRQREPTPPIRHREQWNGYLTTAPCLPERSRSPVAQRRYQRISPEQRAMQAQQGLTHLLLNQRDVW
jgi:hypothetical protein